MSNHTHINFYLSETGGKFHLPAIGWDADVDQAACRGGIMLASRYDSARIVAEVASIEAGRHSAHICKRCARIAISRAAKAQVSEVTNATAKPAKITSTVTLPDGRVETRTGKNAWPFAVCSPGCHADGWGVLRWSRTRQAAEKFQAWCNAQGAEMIVIETEVG